jgi:hypothetical protein
MDLYLKGQSQECWTHWPEQMMLLASGNWVNLLFYTYTKEDGCWGKVETVKGDKSLKSRETVSLLDQETYMEDYANFLYTTIQYFSVFIYLARDSDYINKQTFGHAHTVPMQTITEFL